MDKLTIEEEQQVHKILRRRNKRMFNDIIIASMIGTLNKLRSKELRVTDWFVPDKVDYLSYLYHFGLYKFVDLNNTT